LPADRRKFLAPDLIEIRKQMTKVTTAIVAPEAAPAPARTIHQPKPETLKLIGATVPTLAKAAVHIRNGYIFSPDVVPEVFGAAGMIGVTLVLGSPEQYAIEEAAQESAEAMAAQERQRQRDIQEAAAQLVADNERAAVKAAAAVKVATAEAALAAAKAAEAAV
jgi:hypothetical protein